MSIDVCPTCGAAKRPPLSAEQPFASSAREREEALRSAERGDTALLERLLWDAVSSDSACIGLWLYREWLINLVMDLLSRAKATP